MNRQKINALPCRWRLAVLVALWALAGFALRPLPWQAAEGETEPVQAVWIFEAAPETDHAEAAPSGPAEPAPLHVLENCLITHYDPCALCCGKTDGITASGAPAVPGVTCAVDPGLIPLGSTVWVDFGGGEWRRYLAQDTGSGVTGGHVDLCVESHEEALRLGALRRTVYWEAPA